MVKNFYDTCSLLNLQEKAFESNFVISSKTLEEIENIKISANKDNEIKFKARNLVRLLDENLDKFETIVVDRFIYKIVEAKNLIPSNDNLICASAVYYKDYGQPSPIRFYSEDLNCRMIARDIFGLDVHSVKELIDDSNEEYVGYKEVILNDEEMADFYEHLYVNKFNCLVNEYLIIKNTDNEVVDKRKWNGDGYFPLFFKPTIKNFLDKVSPINLEQELAFDLLQNKQIGIKLLTGIFGSGKDYIMIANALNLIQKNKFKKIMWIRNNVEVKNSKPIGFLPGNMTDKLISYAMPIADHVGGIDGINFLISNGNFEIEHLGFIRGRNIENTIIYCSESENLTKEHIQLLIGRVGKGSELWLNGDLRQVDLHIDSGLGVLINKLKNNKKFGFVKLKKTERSEIAQLADLLD